jgi:hypothetical protein
MKLYFDEEWEQKGKVIAVIVFISLFLFSVWVMSYLWNGWEMDFAFCRGAGGEPHHILAASGSKYPSGVTCTFEGKERKIYLKGNTCFVVNGQELVECTWRGSE